MAHESTMLALGTAAPDFALPSVASGDVVRLDDFAESRVLLVMFMCNHCPYVKHVADQLAALGRDYTESDVAIVAITANDVATYPEDSPQATVTEIEARGYVFPYLFDETQEIAQAYTAACTPDFFLFGEDRTLVYRGRLDGSKPGTDEPVTGSELRAAIEAVRAGGVVATPQYPSMGCNIKWREGNEPPYFG